MADRQARLLALIERATGKSAYSGGQPDEGEDVDGDDDAIEATLTIAADPAVSAVLGTHGAEADDRVDEESDEGQGEDRTTWESRVGPDIMQLCDRIVDIANEIAHPPLALRYGQTIVSLSLPGRFFRAAGMYPKKQFLAIRLNLSRNEEWLRRLDEAGLGATQRASGSFVFRIAPADLRDKEALIRELVHQSVREYQS